LGEVLRATFDIFLPPMATGDVQALSPTQATAVGFGPAGKAELATILPQLDPSVFDRVQVDFPAGSAVDDAGTPATRGVIIPVPPDRLPGPLPPGQDPRLVISIQAPGATIFAVPAPVTFPNLDGLLPGQKSLIWSFNHDAGSWDVVGTGTVSADGLMIVSDPGVGIRAPGWHFTQPGNTVEGEGTSIFDPFNPCDSPSYRRLMTTDFPLALDAYIFNRYNMGQPPENWIRIQKIGEAPFNGPIISYDNYQTQ
jgi:hypothetical protein